MSKFNVVLTLPGDPFAALSGLLSTDASVEALRELLRVTEEAKGPGVSVEMGVAALAVRKTPLDATDAVYARLGTISEGENIHV
jgi:hypothetical protein